MTDLSHSEQLELVYRTLDLLPDMVYWLDEEANVVLVNSAVYQIMGYTREEMQNMSVYDFDEEIRKETWKDHLDKLSSNKIREFTTKHRKKNGEIFLVEVRSQKITFNDKVFISGIVRDISERKRFEAALATSEEKFLKAFQNNPSAVYLSSLPEGRLVEVNNAFVSISGYSREELIGKTVEELNFYESPEDRIKLLETLKKQGKLTGYEISYRVKSGKLLYCSVNAEPLLIGNQTYLVGVISDITDRHHAMLKLMESEEKFRLLAENIPENLWIGSEAGEIQFLSRNVEKVLGINPEQLVKKGPEGLYELIHEEDRQQVVDSHRALFDFGEPHFAEYRLQREDGGYSWIHERAMKTRLEGRDPLIFGISRDITATREAEQSIIRERDRARQYLDMAGTIIVAIDINQQVILINRKGCELFGVQEQEILGENWFDTCLPPEVRERSRKGFRSLMEGEVRPTQYRENRIVAKNGNIYLVAWNTTLVQDEQGKIIGTLNSGEDITIRRQTEMALVQSEQKYRMLIENIPEVIWSADQTGKASYISANVEKITGFTPRELVAVSNEIWMNRVHVEDQEQLSKVFDGLITKGEPYDIEYRFQRKDGVWIWIHDRALMTYEEDQKTFAFGSFSEITERKGWEKALMESEEKFRQLISSIDDVFWIVSHDWEDFIYLSPAYEKIWGRPVTQVYENSMAWTDSIHPDDKPQVLQAIKNLGSQRTFSFPEYRIIRPDGEMIWIRSRAYPILDETGNVERFAGLAENVTEQKESEKALRQSMRMSDDLVRTIPLGIIIYQYEDPDRLILVDANQVAAELTGLRFRELKDKEINEFWPDAREMGMTQILLNVMNSGETYVNEALEVNLRGRNLILKVRIFGLPDNRLAVAFDDVTEQKNAEEALRVYQENLRSLATELTSVEERERRAIAEYLHDYLGQSLALAKIKIGRALRKGIEDQAATVMSEVEKDVTDAINYSQSVIYELSPPILYELGLLEAVKWKLNDFEQKQGIRTRLNLPDHPPEIDQEISIVLFRSITELLNNVVKHAAAGQVAISLKEEGEELVLSVADDGIGMEDKILFTDHSKEHKFGIFSIRERMNHYGGGIRIDNPSKGGTIVTLFLPLNHNSPHGDTSNSGR